jgi:hypothetical protein
MNQLERMECSTNEQSPFPKLGRVSLFELDLEISPEEVHRLLGH